MRKRLHQIGEYIKRMNQVILVFPVWVVLGISGLFRRKGVKEGWRESELNKQYERMY